MKLSQTIGFLGTGNMAEALIKGLLSATLVEPTQIYGSDPRRERCEELSARYGIHVTTHNVDVVRHAQIVVLSVKPQILPAVCDEVAEHIKPHALIISIAAGIPVAAIERHFAPGTRIVRTMPNTPALVGAGATAIAAGDHATEEDLQVARSIFDAVGKSVTLDEDQLDAVTGLSGSGPAYVFLIIEALSDAGVKMGLSRYNAQSLAAQTVLGSAKMLIETNEHPGRLKDMVTSPGGTAIAGLHTLEAGGLRTTLINAVEAATRRSRELGEAAAAEEEGMSFDVKEDGSGVTFEVQVVPRASRERIGPAIGERLKVQLTAPPVEGAANEALRAALARALGVARGRVRILRGETGRKKTVHVEGSNRAAVLALAAPNAGGGA